MDRPKDNPPFLISRETLDERQAQYPESQERLGLVRSVGKAGGLVRVGIHIVRLPPGHRSSWPHAEEREEEFGYLLEGTVDAWIDGTVHPMKPGDFIAFPAGTGTSHTFINNGSCDAKLLIGGEADKDDNRIYYPLHPERRSQLPAGEWWHDVPARSQGPHDGLPTARRASAGDGGDLV